MLKLHSAFLLLITLLTFSSCKIQYPDLEEGIYAEIITTKGTMVAKLAYDKAPITVANFVSLAEGTNTLVENSFKNKKFYNGLLFHRVIDGFMIQGGDPVGDGTGDPGYKFNNEFHTDLKHDKPGVLSMANSGPNSNGSQFFITEVAKPFLDNNYNVFGELVIGLDIQDTISNVKTSENDKPIEDVVIKQLNIIRKGNEAKSFDAPEIFINHFAEIDRIEKEKEAKAKAIKDANISKFKNQKEQATTLPSGLQYIVTKKGAGKKLPKMAKVLIHYAMYFDDGLFMATNKLEIAEAQNQVSERSIKNNEYQPFAASIGPDAKMITGFKEGLQQLSIGDQATLFVPYHLAYGESGGNGFPPKTNLIFEVEIIELVK
ncbi:peptidylprolyl isomerase [Pseudalgibacter alginicilyticus]|uniref:peptidylprolyl isomerase n=1 Tax=Pseudalgibacter alginicilyticus TaxID=1736674 RepID=A0A0P0CV90_9FLAO|nr:peptidylprolyl isomerase [Pseudalgibacter alginicilyticus]